MTGIHYVANSTLPWDPLDREVTEPNFLRFASATVTRIPDWGRIQGKQVTVAVCSFIHIFLPAGAGNTKGVCIWLYPFGDKHI